MPEVFKIRREEPPVAGRKVGDRSRIDKEMKHFEKNPDVWFKVREAASSGAYITYKKRGCVTRTKSVGDNKYDIWVMFPSKPDTK